MASSIHDPFLLASYPASKQKTLRNLHPTWEKTTGDGQVTVAADADGIHVLDLSSLHPVVSHTLGPSTSFSGPSASRTDESGVCTTYAVIDTAPDVSKANSGKTVWTWREKTTGALEKSSQKKKEVLLPQAISQIYLPQELASRVLLQSQKGDLFLVDEDLAIQNTLELDSRALKSFFFSRKPCTFLPSRTAPHRGAVVVAFSVSGKATSVRVVAVNNAEGFVTLGEVSIAIDSSDIASISCSASGFISILTRKKQLWHSFRLESLDRNTLSISSPVDAPINLSNFSTTETTILSLGASHVLIAGVTKSPTPEIALLLWDLQFSVLLASQSIAIPSTLSRTQNTAPVTLSLHTATSTQALLALSPAPSVAGRSSVLVVPFVVPAVSTIANAMGKAAAGAKWIATETTGKTAQKPSARDKMVATMTSAITGNRPEAAADAFFEWDKQRSDAYDQEFVKKTLETVLQSTNSSNVPYSSKIVQHLIEKKTVTGGMVEGGLVSALRQRNDWSSILLALENVLSITEDEIISTLQLVVSHHRNTSSDAMQVDSSSTSEILSLPTYLAAAISYTTSPAALRLAVRQQMPEAEDIVVVLEVIDGWLEASGRKDTMLLPAKNRVSKTDRGVTVLKAGKGKKEAVPPLSKILAFLQTTLDASFLALLQHPPSHLILQKLSLQLEPEVALSEQLEELRGPLELFAKAQAKAVREGSEGGKREPAVDWRKRKKELHAQTGIAVGLYRLEELVL